MQTIETNRAGLAKLPKNQWVIVYCEGFTFKVFDNWAQIMQTPNGLRESGMSGHKSRKAFVAELVAFINLNVPHC